MKHNIPTVGFAFSTKERVEFSRRSLHSIDNDSGFDLIWLDGSTSEEGRRLPESIGLRKTRLVETHLDITSGPDAAIRYGLRRLLALGYDYCGLIENDIEFVPGWFSRLMELFRLGELDGLQVGAATTRTFSSRALTLRPQYATLWNLGAGMVLFTRRAAHIVLRHYRPRRSRELSHYFRKTHDNDLKHVWELWMDKYDRWLGCDWGYSLELDKCGLSSLGTVPTFSYNLDLDPKTFSRSEYVGGIAGTVSEVPARDVVSILRQRVPGTSLVPNSGDNIDETPAQSHRAARLAAFVLAIYWKLRLPLPILRVRRMLRWLGL